MIIDEFSVEPIHIGLKLVDIPYKVSELILIGMDV